MQLENFLSTNIPSLFNKVYIVVVLTKSRMWKMPTFQEKVKTEYLLFQKRDANQIKKYVLV